MYAMYKHLAFSFFLRSEQKTWNEHNYLQILIFRFVELHVSVVSGLSGLL